MSLHSNCISVLAVIYITFSFKNVLSKPLFTVDMEMAKSVTGDTYMTNRNKILLSEKHDSLGGELVMSADEMLANSVLMSAKQAEINASHYGGQPFAPSINFLLSKDLVEKSDIFKIIQKMPKGAALHLHDSSMTSINWLVKNATYRDHCYMCVGPDQSIVFNFYQTPPPNKGCQWKLVKQARQDSGNTTQFDDMIYQSMTLPASTANESLDKVWQRFNNIFAVENGLLNYRPVFTDYYYEALKEFHDDHVQYLEFRGLLPEVYELDGTVHDKRFAMEIYQNVTAMFLTDYPDFTGAKVIKSELRFKAPADVLSDIKDTLQLMKQFPGFLIGYDLVGQEDPLHSLLYYLDALRYPSQQSPPLNLPYFFHAGETDWQGTQTDENLIDAILLNTTRIGHGYALVKHPELMKMVKQRDIAIEINPISNQVLKLVDNLQNHPGADLIAQDFPVVISADDPALWNAKGLSYDFYMAFMALSGKDGDLRLLKQLAMNSLIYSGMSRTEKVTALKSWTQKWEEFVKHVKDMK